MYLGKDVFLVVGGSLSGSAAAEFLLSHGAKCYICDGNAEVLASKTITDLCAKGAIPVCSGEIDEALSAASVAVLSPGVPIDGDIPLKAKRMGKRIVGEMELGFLYSVCPIAAVTGTNGKTTTCSLISEILSKAGIKNKLVGNVGVPFISKISEMDENTVAVTEVSSFQLETLGFFRPHIAVITNISEDHLSRHYNMQNYIFLKSKLLSNLRESEYAVLNRDDYTVRGFKEKTKGKTVFFSTKEKVYGAYAEDDTIFCFGEAIMERKLVGLSGEHNLSNVLAAVAASKLLGAPNDAIAEAVIGFKGVKHRIEYICTAGGVDYYDDSKATNADSAVKGVSSMKKPVILLLGGRDKGQNFDELFLRCKELGVVKAVLYGESRFKMLRSAERAEFTEICVASGMMQAVALAAAEAREGDCVLLSPACASFDEFSGYEERGDKFAEAVRKLK